MLKKKIQSLVAEEKLGNEGNFQIIYDSNAVNVIGGGVEACPRLSNCDNFTGDCQALSTCGVYKDATAEIA